jgi:predicted nucleotidyltransferase
MSGNGSKLLEVTGEVLEANLREKQPVVSEETPRLATVRLVAEFHPQRVILFGSQARGRADARSDVDLLVICSVPAQRGARRALMVAMDRALGGLGFAKDIVILTPEEFDRDRQIPGTVARPAWREGKVLYEAPGAGGS